MSHPCLLIYDIPEHKGIDNPSPVLRRLAIRIQYSSWVILESDIPYNYLGEFQRQGATWDVVRFDPSEAPKLVAMCIRSLKAEIAKTLSRARRAKIQADEALEDGTCDDAREVVARYRAYRRQAKELQARLESLLADSETAIARFGISGSDIGLSGLRRTAQAIRTGMHERARVYHASLIALSVHRGSQDGIVRAGKADAIHPGIVADYMDEYGLSADQLRTAFQE